MCSSSTDTYDKSIEANEDLDSQNELEGQPECASNGNGLNTNQNLPAQGLQNNFNVQFQQGIIGNGSASVLGNTFAGFASHGRSSSLFGMSTNHRNKHKLVLKRLGRPTRNTGGKFTRAHYLRIGKII